MRFLRAGYLGKSNVNYKNERIKKVMLDSWGLPMSREVLIGKAGCTRHGLLSWADPSYSVLNTGG